MERQGFDDQWKKAFENAEVSPSENVWTNIAHDLEKTGDANRKLWFYKLVAAASIFFAIAAGATGFYLFQQNTVLVSKQQEMDEQRNADAKRMHELLAMYEAEAASGKNAANGLEQLKMLKSENTALRLANAVANSRRPVRLQVETSTEVTRNNETHTVEERTALSLETASLDYITASDENEVSVGERAAESTAQIAFLPSNAFKNSENERSANQDEVVAQLLAKLQQREEELRNVESRNKQESTYEKVWSSVGFAAGSFNAKGSTGISPTSQNQALYSSNVASRASSQEAKANGVAYSVGFSVGKKVAARWIVQSGVNYLKQSSNYTAESAFGNAQYQEFKPESINEYGKLSQESLAKTDTKIVKTAPYTVNNTVRYLSVPVQAGYLIVNTRLGFQLNAGISTDLFLQNTKSANGENLQKIDQEIGDADVPYKTMNFSGLLGSELSYRFGSRYRLALNPGLRYPFSSIYKSGLGVKSTPLTLDLGLRFRYIFQ